MSANAAAYTLSAPASSPAAWRAKPSSASHHHGSARQARAAAAS